jgi:hypothetical protein
MFHYTLNPNRPKILPFPQHDGLSSKFFKSIKQFGLSITEINGTSLLAGLSSSQHFANISPFLAVNFFDFTDVILI